MTSTMPVDADLATGPAAGPVVLDPVVLDPVVLARAEWPTAPDDTLPAVPGFVTSTFSPLVVEVAQRCLRAFFGPDAGRPGAGASVPVSCSPAPPATWPRRPPWRRPSARSAACRRCSSTSPPRTRWWATSTARWHLGGPVVCTVPLGDAMADARACADLLIHSGDADAVLVIVADQARAPHESDHAAALLIGPGSWTERDEVS